MNILATIVAWLMANMEAILKWLSGLFAISLLVVCAGLAMTGCMTTTAPDGTVTQALDQAGIHSLVSDIIQGVETYQELQGQKSSAADIKRAEILGQISALEKLTNAYAAEIAKWRAVLK